MQFSDWLAGFQATAWDEQLEADVKAGKLDELMREAKADFAADKCKPF